jgi:hypothetical protein
MAFKFFFEKNAIRSEIAENGALIGLFVPSERLSHAELYSAKEKFMDGLLKKDPANG